MQKEAGFLKHEAHRSFMGCEITFLVMPDIVVVLNKILIHGIEASDGPQQRCLSASGGSKEGRNAMTWDREFGLQSERITMRLDAYMDAHGRSVTARRFNVNTANNRANDSSRSPPDSQCALA
jgi:hypothetical protein